jgi:hypothetical protein
LTHAYCRKEYPAQDLPDFEKVSSTINGTRCECGCGKLRGMSLGKKNMKTFPLEKS